MAGSPLVLAKRLFVGIRDEAPPDFPAVGVAHSERGAFTRAAGAVDIQTIHVGGGHPVLRACLWRVREYNVMPGNYGSRNLHGSSRTTKK